MATAYSIYSPSQFMNPGPAPRPPGSDKPRLNYTPQVSGLPGNMSKMSLQSNSAMSSSASLNNASFDQIGSDSNIVKEGWSKIKEEGGFMKSVFWSDKYMVLRERQLDFLKNNTTNKVSFSIPLKDVINVTRSESYPYAFELTKGVSGASQQSPSKDGPQKVFVCRFDSDSEVYAWIDGIYDRAPAMGGVSQPTGFAHRVHVGFDPINGGFTGLPPEWQRLLNSSALTKDDMAKNPQAVVEVLQFYTDTMQKRPDMPNPGGAVNKRDMQMGGGGGGFGSSVAPPRPQPPSAYNSSPSASPLQHPISRSNTGLSQNEYFRDDNKQNGYGSPGDSREQSPSPSKYPVAQRAAPPPPSTGSPKSSPAPARPLQAQRQAPGAPPGSTGKAPMSALNGNAVMNQVNGSPGQASAKKSTMPSGLGYQNRPKQSPGKAAVQQSPHVVASPKPLNVTPKIGHDSPGSSPNIDHVKKAEAALTAKPTKEEKKEQRMSSMTDSQVMERLREVVSKERPLDSYNKQKKIGQGASGSVYVARIRESATSPTARQLLRDMGPRAQVAIKQMDLRNQPRKELIVNEIIVMKDSKHPNIVNFLDSFLQEETNELWVVMEFMEGGALTDVIDNNPSISEDQIATICLEVSHKPPALPCIN